MKKRKLNVRLLRRIQKHIAEEPRRFFMQDFLDVGEPNEQTAGWSDEATRYPACGTVACIAGWANILTGSRRDFSAVSDVTRAAEKLGLKIDKWQLFDASDWPNPFSEQYVAAKTPRLRTKIACARIDHLIKTGE